MLTLYPRDTFVLLYVNIHQLQFSVCFSTAILPFAGEVARAFNQFLFCNNNNNFSFGWCRFFLRISPTSVHIPNGMMQLYLLYNFTSFTYFVFIILQINIFISLLLNFQYSLIASFKNYSGYNLQWFSRASFF